MPPLPCGGICGEFKSVPLDVPVGRAGDGEIVLVGRTERAVDDFSEDEMGAPVDRDAVEIVRRVDADRTDDVSWVAEAEALADEEILVDTVTTVDADRT